MIGLNNLLKNVLLLTFSSILFITAQAQTTNDSVEVDLIIKFGSACCGTAKPTKFKTAIKQFEKEQKIKIKDNYQILGLGREGEYIIAFNLKLLNEKQKINFINKIKKVKYLKKEKPSQAYEEIKVLDKSTKLIDFSAGRTIEILKW